MKFSTNHKEYVSEIVNLFDETFSASEGAEEGQLIADLARRLLDSTQDENLIVALLLDHKKLCGVIIFSRLFYPDDNRDAFIMAPVAVSPAYQGKRLGQGLIKYGLEKLKTKKVSVALTYGDPAFYSKVGFEHISEKIAKAPLSLSQPEGWLAQSLTDGKLVPLTGPSICVEALNNPIYW